jgi:hypothetical protein
VGLGLVVGVSRLHSDTINAIGFLWTSEDPVAMNLPGNNKHLKETGFHAPAGFKPAVPESKRPQTHALNRAATGIGILKYTSKSKQKHRANLLH